ncbi:hypothetical protein ABT276_09720 [Streptomyces xantholiticus]|uniref:Uncharacterized protein n=1 Tax=Streptomyces xantholiticus TaxID=68285 RepID=A0ABV1US89_9ACTN
MGIPCAPQASTTECVRERTALAAVPHLSRPSRRCPARSPASVCCPSLWPVGIRPRASRPPPVAGRRSSTPIDPNRSYVFDDLVDICRTWGADVLIAGSEGHGAEIAARFVGIPFVRQSWDLFDTSDNGGVCLTTGSFRYSFPGAMDRVSAIVEELLEPRSKSSWPSARPGAEARKRSSAQSSMQERSATWWRTAFVWLWLSSPEPHRRAEVRPRPRTVKAKTPGHGE